MKSKKKNLDIGKILFLSVLIIVVSHTAFAQYVPPVMDGFTHYNRDYYNKMVAEDKPMQESPWGFQEINIEGVVENNVSSIDEYLTLYKNNTFNNEWSDGKTHIINFADGEYIIPNDDNYFIMQVPSKTIIQGAGIGKTVFKATTLSVSTNQMELRIGENVYKVNLESKDLPALFALDNCDDVVLRDFSFYNETKDNKWSLLRGTDWSSTRRENFLFENIEFDDSFGALGVRPGCNYNFVTFRGLRKRIGNTTKRIKANYKIPAPGIYQFTCKNYDNIQLSGQIEMRIGNSVVFHDCVLGDNISATIDINSNYIEFVGVSFIDPLHDHSLKSPNANHLYIHDSKFELTYTDKIFNSYYNPTFFTHVGGGLANYHFKNLSFSRAGQIKRNGRPFRESEPFTLYDNRDDNNSGDMVWENIQFSGYDNQIVGYPNVQTKLGFQAINYTDFTARQGQMQSHNAPAYTVAIEKRTGNSKTDGTGVYSWGQKTDGSIDFPRDNRTFVGTKSEMESLPYVRMANATVKTIYNKRLTAPGK